MLNISKILLELDRNRKYMFCFFGLDGGIRNFSNALHCCQMFEFEQNSLERKYQKCREGGRRYESWPRHLSRAKVLWQPWSVRLKISPGSPGGRIQVLKQGYDKKMAALNCCHLKPCSILRTTLATPFLSGVTCCWPRWLSRTSFL